MRNTLPKIYQRVGRIAIAIFLPTVFCLTGCKSQTQPPKVIPEVSVVSVQPERVVLTTELPGRTMAFRVAEIRPQVNGLIKKRLFTEGAYVKEGEVLYDVDSAHYVAAYNNAAANLESAKQAEKKAQAVLNSSIADLQRHEAVLKLANLNRDRYAKLVSKKAISAMEYDKAVADVDVAKAALKVAHAQIKSNRQLLEEAKAAIQQAEALLQTAKINLDYTKILSPISGHIGRSNVTDGDLVTAYQPAVLATVQQIDPIYVDVPESTVKLLRLRRSLKEGQLKAKQTDNVTIILEDGTKYPLQGSLQFADVTVDQTTGSFILRIIVPNPDGTLLPGMFVRAILEEGVCENAVLIPQQAVSRDTKGNPLVLVVDDEDKVQRRPISLDRSLDNRWLVSSGLAEGDRVITTGIQNIHPGTEKVKVSQNKEKGMVGSSESPKDGASDITLNRQLKTNNK